MRILKLAGIALASLCLSRAVAADPVPAHERLTFNKHIAPLVFERCAGCHHPGEVAPFSLLSYSDVKKRAKQIVQVTKDQYMPPWKTVEGHGRFVGERRLSKEEIALISRWVEQGAAEGDAKDLPAAPKFNDGWKLGTPDIVITMPEPFTVPAEGADIYRNFVLPLNVPEGKYIKALEYRPSNRRVVHHAALRDRFQRQLAQRPTKPIRCRATKGSLNIPGILFPGSLSAWTPGPRSDAAARRHCHALEERRRPRHAASPASQRQGRAIEQSSLGFYLTDQAAAAIDGRCGHDRPQDRHSAGRAARSRRTTNSTCPSRWTSSASSRTCTSSAAR